MITPQLKTLMSVDLERPSLPNDPDNCEVFLEATIGPDGSDAADIRIHCCYSCSAYLRDTLSMGQRTAYRSDLFVGDR